VSTKKKKKDPQRPFLLLVDSLFQSTSKGNDLDGESLWRSNRALELAPTEKANQTNERAHCLSLTRSFSLSQMEVSPRPPPPPRPPAAPPSTSSAFTPVVKGEDEEAGATAAAEQQQVLRLRMAPHEGDNSAEIVAECPLEHPFFIKEKGKEEKTE